MFVRRTFKLKVMYKIHNQLGLHTRIYLRGKMQDMESMRRYDPFVGLYLIPTYHRGLNNEMINVRGLRPF